VISIRTKWLRTKLTTSYVLALALILALYICSTSVVVLWHLRAQLHRHTVQDLETVEGLLFFGPDGKLQLNEEYHNHPESKSVQERFLEVLAPDGTLLYRNDRLGGRSLGGKPFAGEGEGGYSPRSASLSDGTSVFLISRLHILDGHPLIIRLAYSQEPIWDTIQQTMTMQLLCLVVVLVAATLAGYLYIKRALAPLEKMAIRAQQISAERLYERIEIDDMGEISDLAHAFNKTLGRLETSFEQIRRFTSDVSHELRTPLAAIRCIGEVSLQKNGSREEYSSVIGSMLEEIDHVTRLVDDLLMISKADEGDLRLNASPISVCDVSREATELISILAEEKDQSLTFDGNERAVILGDRTLLRQAVVNILDNAVKYSPSGSAISMKVRCEGKNVFVEVADQGCGIPAECRDKVFERFYRVDKARTRDAGGAGLGLSIAKWAVDAHGGSISVNSNLNGGCTFQIQLRLYPDFNTLTGPSTPEIATCERTGPDAQIFHIYKGYDHGDRLTVENSFDFYRSSQQRRE
jgi:heavy metal sensor kinase